MNGHVGHGAVLHGCRVGDDVLIGIGAIVLDGAVIGRQAFVGVGGLDPWLPRTQRSQPDISPMEVPHVWFVN